MSSKMHNYSASAYKLNQYLLKEEKVKTLSSQSLGRAMVFLLINLDFLI